MIHDNNKLENRIQRVIETVPRIITRQDQHEGYIKTVIMLYEKYREEERLEKMKYESIQG